MRSHKFWRLLPVALLVVSAGWSSALTLGRYQGLAQLGQPLDVTVQVGLDPGGSINDLCAEAEVLYGDTRLDARAVGLQATPGSGETGTLRIRTTTPIDEPFATVNVRIGCTQRLTRTFVLLTEQPNDVAAAAAQPSPAPPVTLTPTELAPLAPAAPAASVRPVSEAAAPVSPAPRVSTSPRTAAAAPVRPERAATARRASAPPRQKPAAAAKPAAPKPVVTETSRLRLDPLEARPVVDAAKASPATPAGAASAVQGTPAQDAGAVPAPAPPTEEAARNAQRIQALEADIKALRDGMVKSEAVLGDVRGRLERAEGERYANGLVYLLAGLLAAACVLAAFLALRGRSSAPAETVSGDKWWLGRGHTGPDELHDDDDPPARRGASRIDPVPRAASLEAPAVVGASPEAETSSTSAPIAVAVAPEDASQPTQVIAPSVSAPLATAALSGLLGRAAAVATPSRPNSTSMSAAASAVDKDPVKIDELSDLQQQADFFVSLGEYDRAIDVLKAHVDARPQASAIAWLDLLDIFHRLGRKAEFEQLRSDFEWLFNASIPSFDAFTTDDAGLEAYPKALSRIQSLWPSARALEVIDDAITRRPGAEGTEAFGLQAYRELLLLHNIAGELAAPEVLDDDAQALPAVPVSRVSAQANAAPLFGATEFEQLPAFLGDLEATSAGDLPPLDGLLELPDIDINLDDLPATGGAVASAPVEGGAAVAAPLALAARSEPGQSNLLEFDLDLDSIPKLPPTPK